MHVLHWQASGVAWVPWRIKQLIPSDSGITVSLTGRVAELLECYGIQNPVKNVSHPHLADCDADIVHLHHAQVADRNIDVVRARWPEAKVVVTVHGYPDREDRYVCQSKVDAYHVVAPDLMEIYVDHAPVMFIPNHPARSLADRSIADLDLPPEFRDRRMFVPFSHVKKFKDHDVMEMVRRKLEVAGWEVVHAKKRMSNAEILEELRNASACWVQLRGYLDILTMECWSMGCLPVVLDPGSDSVLYRGVWGGKMPDLCFSRNDPDSISATILEGGWRDSVPANYEFMRSQWNECNAGLRWASFYNEVAKL